MADYVKVAVAADAASVSDRRLVLTAQANGSSQKTASTTSAMKDTIRPVLKGFSPGLCGGHTHAVNLPAQLGWLRD